MNVFGWGGAERFQDALAAGQAQDRPHDNRQNHMAFVDHQRTEPPRSIVSTVSILSVMTIAQLSCFTALIRKKAHRLRPVGLRISMTMRYQSPVLEAVATICPSFSRVMSPTITT